MTEPQNEPKPVTDQERRAVIDVVFPEYAPVHERESGQSFFESRDRCASVWLNDAFANYFLNHACLLRRELDSVKGDLADVLAGADADCHLVTRMGRELEAAKARIAELERENDAIRQMLGLSDKPCVYCGEKSLATCPKGFPGCGRADDIMLGPMPTEPGQEREDVVRGRLAHYQGELERLMVEKAIIMGETPHVAPPLTEEREDAPEPTRPTPYRVDIGGVHDHSLDDPHVRFESWSRAPTETEARLDDFVYRYEEAKPYMDWLEGRIAELEGQ